MEYLISIIFGVAVASAIFFGLHAERMRRTESRLALTRMDVFGIVRFMHDAGYIEQRARRELHSLFPEVFRNAPCRCGYTPPVEREP